MTQKKKDQQPKMPNDDNTLRINRFLSMCGIGSRRHVENYILNGNIKVNGVTVKELSKKIDPRKDMVEYNGKIVTPVKETYYIILNKPKGYVSTMFDPGNRPTIIHLLPEKYINAGVFPVGRLDMDTEGLILFTNDGELSNILMHPRFDSEKEYIVDLDRPLDEKDRLRIEKGMKFREFRSKPAKCTIIDNDGKRICIIIKEGKKRQIRITFQKMTYKVKKLQRVAVGPIRLGFLKQGKFRLLNKKEIKILLDYAQKLSDGKDFNDER